MTTAIRYKDVRNTTGAILTIAGVPPGDGDDRAIRYIQRVWATADLGTAAGQLRHAGGAIADILPNLGSSVLSISGITYRPVPANGGIYSLGDEIDIQVTGDDPVESVDPYQADIRYFINPADGTLRVHDNAPDDADGSIKIQSGDISIITVVMGEGTSWLNTVPLV